MSMSQTRPWYHGGLRFQCAGCGACCTGTPGYVWVNKAEIIALAAALGTDVERFQRKYVRLVGVRKSLVELPGGECVFFDQQVHQCKVYQVRPRQCRTWPFWPSNLRSPECWAAMAERCPGANRGPLVAVGEIMARMDALHV